MHTTSAPSVLHPDTEPVLAITTHEPPWGIKTDFSSVHSTTEWLQTRLPPDKSAEYNREPRLTAEFHVRIYDRNHTSPDLHVDIIRPMEDDQVDYMTILTKAMGMRILITVMGSFC